MNKTIVEIIPSDLHSDCLTSLVNEDNVVYIRLCRSFLSIEKRDAPGSGAMQFYVERISHSVEFPLGDYTVTVTRRFRELCQAVDCFIANAQSDKLNVPAQSVRLVTSMDDQGAQDISLDSTDLMGTLIRRSKDAAALTRDILEKVSTSSPDGFVSELGYLTVWRDSTGYHALKRGHTAAPERFESFETMLGYVLKTYW